MNKLNLSRMFLIIMTVLLLGSCGIFKPKCTPCPNWGKVPVADEQLDKDS